jgi:hypothetical protein
MCRKVMAVVVVTAFLMTAIIYTSPSGDSKIESQPPHLMNVSSNNVITFPTGGGYDESYWTRIHTNYTIVEASINLIGLEALNSIQPGLFSLVSSDANDGTSSDPQIVTDIYNNHFIVWVDTGNIGSAQTDPDIFVDQWDGASWKGPVLLSNMKPNSISLGPSVAADPFGNVHVVWYEKSNALASGPDNDIFYCKWDGNNWNPPILLSDDVNDGESITPEIAVDLTGDVYVAWVEDGDISGSGVDKDIVMKRYDYASKVWDSTSVISSDPNDGESVEPAIASSGGAVYLAWSDKGDILNSGIDYDIILSTYWQGSWNAPSPISLDPDDGDSRNATLAANASGVYIAWQDDGAVLNSGSDYDIIQTFVDLKNAWIDPIRVISDDSSFGDSINPTMTLDNFENLYISWADSGNVLGSGSDWDIYYRIQDKIMLRDPVLVTDTIAQGRSCNVSISKDNQNNIQFVWEDTSDASSSGPDEDIFLRNIFFDYRYPMNLKLDIGNNGIWDWNYIGPFDTAATLKGNWLGILLTSFVESHKSSADDDYVTVFFNFSSETTGIVNITDIKLIGTAIPSAPENLTILNEERLHVINHEPVFSWDFIDSDSPTQGMFDVEVGSTADGNDLWNPAPVDTSDNSILYQGAKLQNGMTYYFRVRVADSDGSTWSDWSKPYEFRMNSAPVVMSLSPESGTFDHNITLNWAGEDAESDELTYFVGAYFDNKWHTIVDGSLETNYVWNTKEMAEQWIDLNCYATDGFENSSIFSNSGKIYIGHNTPPKLWILSPQATGTLVDNRYLITWDSEDPDIEDILKISLYYDADNDSAEKNTIIENVDDKGYYQWNTTDVPEGEYYILGVLTDGTETTEAYSNGTIQVGFDSNELPPRIISKDPDENDRSISIISNIIILFNKPIDDSSINHNTFYVKDSKSRLVEGKRTYFVSTSINGTKYELRFEPKVPLLFDTTYTVILKNEIRDINGQKLDGNWNTIGGEGELDDVIWSFSTMMKEDDTTPPYVLTTFPMDGSFNTDVALTISINFSEPLDPVSLSSGTFIVVTKSDYNNWNQNSFDGLIPYGIDGVVSYNMEHFQAIFQPRAQLEYNTTYVVILTPEITDFSGNKLVGFIPITLSNGVVYPHIFQFRTNIQITPEGAPKEEGEDTIVRIFQWEYFYYIFTALLVVLILISVVIIRRRVLMGPIQIRDIFIIYNDGRLLYHFKPKMEITSQDIDDGAVSSMLTAIQDFVKDSFKLTRSSGLNELRHGTLRIVIEHGNDSYVAVVCSGGPITKIRDEMKKVIFDLNVKYGQVLKDWDGNMNSVAGIDKLLVPLILMEKDAELE